MLSQGMFPGRSFAPELAYSGQSQFNTLWTRPTAATMKVEPRDTSLPAWFVLFDAAGTPRVVMIPSAGRTWDITVSGAGGKRTGAEAVSTGYEIYAIWGPGTGLALISEVNATALTFANLPLGYTHKTPVVSFGINNAAGNLLLYSQAGRSAVLRTAMFSYMALSAGVQSAITLIDLSIHAPSAATRLVLNAYALNNSGVSRNCVLYRDAAGAEWAYRFLDVNSNAGGKVQQHDPCVPFDVVGPNPAAWLWYDWDPSSPAGGEGLWIEVRGWEL